MTNKKEMLIDATAKLLKEYDDPEEITTRSIASEAKVNLALINYYFEGKDELIREAISKILNESTKEMYNIPEDLKPKEALFDFLYRMSCIMVEYEKYTRVYIPNLLLENKIELPQMILPFIRAHLGENANENICRLIAFQLVTTFQIIFYRIDDIGNYLGRSIRKNDEIARLIHEELDIMMPDVKK